MSAQPKPDQEKQPFTAWGKEINGLQAGLGFRAGEKRAYHFGERVKIVARIRNLRFEPQKIPCRADRPHRLALAGVAYANMSQKSLAGYWELLALISCGVCIFTVGSLRQNGPKRLQQASPDRLAPKQTTVCMRRRVSRNDATGATGKAEGWLNYGITKFSKLTGQ